MCPRMYLSVYLELSIQPTQVGETLRNTAGLCDAERPAGAHHFGSPIVRGAPLLEMAAA